MKILIDQDIPFIEALFAGVGDVINKPGRAIVSSDLKDVQALIVRSITTVDENLLKEAKHLKFVGSVTSGDDHLDKIVLDSRDIPYYVAKGCNAPAVVRYVLSTIAALQQSHKLSQTPVIAIVGVGCVGGLLKTTLENLGFSPILYDPPRATQEPDFISCEWPKVLQADLICLHVPLVISGDYPTYHLINADVMREVKPGTVILNAARGAVIDNQAIKTAGQPITWCLDVWENEPLIDLAVLQQAFIATPHIAGYSKESQQRAAIMVYHAFCQQFEIEKNDNILKGCLYNQKIQALNWRQTAFNYLNLFEKTAETQEKLLNSSRDFDELRDMYRYLSENMTSS